MSNIVSFMGSLFRPIQTNVVSHANVSVNTNNNNPFASPFLNSSQNREFYAKNNPVDGGFYAGYHNGKPNYVGRNLFIEV